MIHKTAIIDKDAKVHSSVKIGAYSVRFPCPRIARCKDMSPRFLKPNQLNAGLPLSAITLSDKTISQIPSKAAYNPTAIQKASFY